MKNAGQEFERELEIFRAEAEGSSQFFYGYLAVHAAAARNKRIYALLNRTPLFWNTCLGALQAAHLVALGRVFDQGSNHNVDALIRLAQKNADIFSKTELGRRKQGHNASPPAWLGGYLAAAYEPTPADFRRLRAEVKKWRRIYEDKYRDLRHKVFAHRALSQETESAALWQKTNIRELEKLHAFLISLHECLQELYFNGRKPVLRRRRYSLRRMMRLRPQQGGSGAVADAITRQARQFLLSASRAAESKPNARPAGRSRPRGS